MTEQEELELLRLRKRKAQAQQQPTESENLAMDYQPSQERSLVGFGENVLTSGGKFATDIGQGIAAAPGLVWNAIAHPAQVGEALTHAAMTDLPEYLNKRYGGGQQILDTLYSDPVGFAADLSTLLSGAGAVAKAGKFGKFASALETAAGTVDPLTAVARLPVKAAGAGSKLYKSALGPSIAGEAGAERAAENVATGLREEIPVNAAGKVKAREVIDDLKTKIDSEIKGIAPGTTADPVDLGVTAETQVKGLKKFQGAKKAEQQAKIQEMLDTFLAGHDQPMTPEEVQNFKQATYKSLGTTAYDKLGKPGPETEKALASAARAKLEEWAPALKDLNAREASVIGLYKDLEKAVGRAWKNQILGLGTPIAGLAGAGMGYLHAGAAGVAEGATVLAALKIALDNPGFKSKLAIALDRVGRGVATPATKAAVAGRTVAGTDNSIEAMRAKYGY